MHVVQDAGFCGHSNFLNVPAWRGHSAFENWVRDQTAPGKKPRSFEDLHTDAWVIETGGAYLKEPWRSEDGRQHWEGSLEAWVDVAAHLSYDLLTETITTHDKAVLDYDGCDFNGAARQQFVAAQRCGAGLLVDFFRRVGVIPEPQICYLREGDIWRVHFGDDNPQRLGPEESSSPDALWPTVSPDGKSKLFYKDSRLKEPGQSDLGITVGDHSWGWNLASNGWPSGPKSISRAFYLNNYFVALVDAAEGDNWQHLYLVPAVPGPDTWYDCPKGVIQYYFDSPKDLWKHHIQTVFLPQ
jgi:hypothetical protein